MKFIEKIKDKWQRNKAIFAEAYKKGKVVGFDYTLLLWKNHIKFLLRMRAPEDKKKEFRRINTFWEQFLYVIKPYRDLPIYPASNSTGDEEAETVIWVYWNDLAHMPQMVSNCIEGIKRNSNGHRVVVVTENTVADYLQLDDVVWRKYKEGKISRTHFCDIVRIGLLYKYGGVWMDCTILLTRQLPDIVTSSDFYTNHLCVNDDNNIGGGKWSTFFMACHKGNLMMRCTLEIFIEYWKKYDRIADYVWMDYIFHLIYTNIPSVRKMIDSVPTNNPDIWILQTKIAQPFSEKEYAAIFKDNSRFMYKFSYKGSITAPYRDKEGEITLMGRLCGEHQ